MKMQKVVDEGLGLRLEAHLAATERGNGPGTERKVLSKRKRKVVDKGGKK